MLSHVEILMKGFGPVILLVALIGVVGSIYERSWHPLKTVLLTMLFCILFFLSILAINFVLHAIGRGFSRLKQHLLNSKNSRK